ncbi:hypothetical protein MtrunA17_Chr8g0335081 [Medicago truncatula]|uniref:Uncharacterized protein n=1 Tax=Medicago truncatula TaxID=3880 RepID=A0A396GE51_MEDTR|nr:hypothetical protein MtrunA17_Chr8g0335081 [Medicago truncatula]
MQVQENLDHYYPCKPFDIIVPRHKMEADFQGVTNLFVYPCKSMML